MPNPEANYIEKLRNSGLRPTKQRIKICEILFNREKTFHFSINQLMKIINTKVNQKISLATVYNTLHLFCQHEILKLLRTPSDKFFFDTNIEPHHHFFCKGSEELFDIGFSEIKISKVPPPPRGKKVSSVQVIVNLESK